MEQEPLAAWIADRAKRVSAVVMDPYTGRSTRTRTTRPTTRTTTRRSRRRSQAGCRPDLSTVYEPGSVFKMLTATAALGAGIVDAQARDPGRGILQVDGGRTQVDDADHKGSA